MLKTIASHARVFADGVSIINLEQRIVVKGLTLPLVVTIITVATVVGDNETNDSSCSDQKTDNHKDDNATFFLVSRLLGYGLLSPPLVVVIKESGSLLVSSVCHLKL